MTETTPAQLTRRGFLGASAAGVEFITHLGDFVDRSSAASPSCCRHSRRLGSGHVGGVLTNSRRRGEKVVLSSHHPVFPKNAHNAWNDDELLELVDGFDNVIAYVNGHDHAGNYGFRGGVHDVTFRGMVELDTNAYSIVEVHPDHLAVDGFGREPDRLLPFRSQ